MASMPPTPHECDDWHDGLCSECCRLDGPCVQCVPCNYCRGGLAHMWHALLTVDRAFAKAERHALIALVQAAHR